MTDGELPNVVAGGGRGRACNLAFCQRNRGVGLCRHGLGRTYHGRRSGASSNFYTSVASFCLEFSGNLMHVSDPDQRCQAKYSQQLVVQYVD